MSSAALSTSIDAWIERARALEGALRSAGREDLVPAAHALSNALVVSGSARRAHVTDLAVRLIAEIKRCVMDASRNVDPRLLDEARRLGAAKLPAAVNHALARSAASTVSPRRSEDRASDDAWVESFFNGMGHADDDELDALVASVGADPRVILQDDLGTLREPLAALGRNGRDTARVLMKGELQPGLLSDLIQLFAQNNETGRLVIEGGTAKASVFFREGKITDAECGDEVGEFAFFRAMTIREGRFSYQRGVEGESTRIFLSAQHLIMNTLRLMDESS